MATARKLKLRIRARIESAMPPPIKATHLAEFVFGSCSGLCSPEPGFFNLIAVINSDPGNGEFSLLMQWLESHWGGVRVWHLKNPDLEASLRRHGYRRSRLGDFLFKLKPT